MNKPDQTNPVNPMNPTGRDYHAPHAPHPKHSLNDPLQTVTPNPPTAGPVLNQDPKFGNRTPEQVAAGMNGDRNAAEADISARRNPGGSYYAADGTLRNPDGTLQK